MKIGFIGAGKVGCSLGRYLINGNVQVTGYYSRHEESAQEAAEFTNSKVYSDPKTLVRENDAIFITVPDGQIRNTYDRIKEFNISNKQICHCSGAMSAVEAFPNIAEYGAYGYSIHPLFPVSDRFTTYRKMTDAFFCMEGNGPHLNAWVDIISGLGSKCRIIDSASKVKYHAACAISSNLVCSLIYESINLLGECGFSGEEALSALSPLVKANTEKILEVGPVQALTGPVERCDISTVEKHLKCFGSEDDIELYRAVTKKLVQAAMERHPETDYTQMQNLLV